MRLEGIRRTSGVTGPMCLHHATQGYLCVRCRENARPFVVAIRHPQFSAPLLLATEAQKTSAVLVEVDSRGREERSVTRLEAAQHDCLTCVDHECNHFAVHFPHERARHVLTVSAEHQVIVTPCHAVSQGVQFFFCCLL
jgi:hypothetical protein